MHTVIRPTLRSSIYVVVVTLIATVGFVQGSPWPILLAGLLALPFSLVALPGYYLLYAVLALIPGANPSSNSGGETVSADGTVISSTSTGLPSAWFLNSTQVLGVLALTAAAVLNVLLVRMVLARRARTAPRS
jgi:hypothetical protein